MAVGCAVLLVLGLFMGFQDRLEIGVPRRGRSRLVVLLGAAGSLALLLHVLQLSETGPRRTGSRPRCG
jgi:hypothetical protein